MASPMTFCTSASELRVHRSPLDSTVRTALAPRAEMSANARVRVVYQVCAWLTPRITNGVPSASTSRPSDTRIPGGVAADDVLASAIGATSAPTSAAAMRNRLFMGPPVVEWKRMTAPGQDYQRRRRAPQGTKRLGMTGARSAST